MTRKRTRAVTAGSIVVLLSLSSGCGGDGTTSTPASSLDSTSDTTAATLPGGTATTPATTATTTTTSPLLAASTTTTTTPGAGEGIPPTAPTFPPDDRVPETFTVRFDESYVCQLGPAGESDIRATGAIVAEVDVSPEPDLDVSGYPVTGEGDLSVTGYLRGGDLCTGEAVGTHRARLDGTIEMPLDGAPRLELVVSGTWYEAWDGEISCAEGLPMSGPWKWPPEYNEETLVFSPLEHGAMWAKSVTYGLCEGTVERTIEF